MKQICSIQHSAETFVFIITQLWVLLYACSRTVVDPKPVPYWFSLSTAFLLMWFVTRFITLCIKPSDIKLNW